MVTEPTTPPLVDLIADGVEPPIDFDETAELPELRVGGRPMNKPKLYRAARRGVGGVRLETAVIGGRLVTTRPAVRRWLVALNDRRSGRTTSAGGTPRQQQAAAKRAHAAAMAELTRAGLAGRRTGK